MKIMAFTFRIYWAQLTNKVRRAPRVQGVTSLAPASAGTPCAARAAGLPLCRLAGICPAPRPRTPPPPRQVDLTIVATSVLLLALDTLQLEAVKVRVRPTTQTRGRGWCVCCECVCGGGGGLQPAVTPCSSTAWPFALLGGSNASPRLRGPTQALRVLRAAKPLRALTRSAGMRLVFK